MATATKLFSVELDHRNFACLGTDHEDAAWGVCMIAASFGFDGADAVRVTGLDGTIAVGRQEAGKPPRLAEIYPAADRVPWPVTVKLKSKHRGVFPDVTAVSFVHAVLQVIAPPEHKALVTHLEASSIEHPAISMRMAILARVPATVGLPGFATSD